MVIFSLDLALSTTGIAIFDKNSGDFVEKLEFSTQKDQKIGVRLKDIFERFYSLKTMYKPCTIVMERAFIGFPKSVEPLYKVHGVVNYLFWDCEQIYYSPKKVKATIVKGNANKMEVQKAILKRYPDLVFKSDNESDAFAIGLTYFIENKIIEWKDGKDGAR